MSHRTSSLALLLASLLSALFSAACSGAAATSTSAADPEGHDDASGDDGTGTGSGDGTNDGTSAVTDVADADDEEGAPWNGSVAAPQRLGGDVLSYTATSDGHVLFATRTAVFDKPSPTVPAVSLEPSTWADYPNLSHVGRVAILARDNHRVVSAWAAGVGIRALPGVTVEPRYLQPNTFATASGDVVLLTRYTGSAATPEGAAQQLWLLSAKTLDVRPLTLPSPASIAGCVTHGETIVCTAAREDGKTDVVRIDAAGLTLRATVAGTSRPTDYRSADGGDALLVRTRSGIWRVPYDGEAAPARVSEGDQVVALQNGFVATGSTTKHEVEIMRADGSNAAVVATNADLANWVVLADTASTRRLRFLPICAFDPTSNGTKLELAVGAQHDLRFYEPLTGKTSAASSSCYVRTMAFSDRFAIVDDNHTTSPGSGTEYGDPMLFDLRLATKVPSPMTDDRQHAIGRSRVIGSGSLSPGDFFDGNSAPGTKSRRVLPDGVIAPDELVWKGVLGRRQGPNEAVAELFYIPL